MRFERIRIHAFGTLSDLDTGERPLPRLVVVEGPNEAGKSTFFQLLTSLLYGFYPASRDTNPYAPWSGHEASAEATLLLDGDVHWEVHRRLLSSPAGTLVRGERSEDLRNRTLPCAEHVPREVFRQVFSLTLPELTSLGGDGWNRVQDRLISGMGSTDLQSPREVADDLERRAGRLWRPNQRGNQEVRALRERMKELKIRRLAAAEADRKLRETDRELQRSRAELREAREEREACLLYLDRCGALLPVRDRLRRIAELEAAAGASAELESLPPDPAARLEELGRALARLERRRQELDQEIRTAQADADRFDEAMRRLVEERTAIRTALARAAAMQPERVRLAQVGQEARDLGRRVEALAGELLAGEPTEAGMQALRGLSTAPVQEAAEAVRRAADLALVAEQADTEEEGVGPDEADGTGVRATDHGGTASLPRQARLTGGTLLLAGAVLAWLGAGGGGVTLALGALLLALGALLLGLALGTERRAAAERAREVAERTREAERARRRAAEARERERHARDELASRLGDLPVRDEVLVRPPGDLGGRIQRLQELVRDRTDREEERARLEERLDGTIREIRTVGERVGLDLPEEPGAAAHVLEEALREAERLAERARAAADEITRLRNRLQEVRTEEAHLTDERDRLRTRILRLGDGDEAAGLERVSERLAARDRARQLREELEREHPDLPDLRRRIREAEEAGADWTLDEEALARRRTRAEELTHRIEELASRARGLERDLAHGRDGGTVADVEGEIELLRDRLEVAVRESDRLRVLATLIRQADRRFREEHQPDILRRAGRHLESVTGGRYRRILVGEPGDGPRFRLRGPGYPGAVDVEAPISTGTREQVYLALRLAILDHLDRHGERLPLFVDEALVNWDPERRGRGLALLDAATGTRQVFVFTCHPEMAEDLVERGARRLTLPAPA